MGLDQPPISTQPSKKGHTQVPDDHGVAAEYRSTLQRLAEASQSEYDKAVMTLSGGALGISFGYLKDIAGPPPHTHVGLLVTAWLCWTISVTACLFSLAFAGWALRKAIDQHDSGRMETEHPGGIPDFITTGLNWSGGILFAVGTAFMIFFAVNNQNEQPTPPSQSTPAASTAPSSPAGRTASGTEPRSSGASEAAQPAGAKASVETNQKAIPTP